MATRSGNYRPDIDGLRAVAVISVIAFHFFPEQAPGGFVGVDVFFVISGYLITGVVREGLELGTFTYGGFYSRRVRRIFPALVLVLAACLGFGWFVLLPVEYGQLGKHVFAGAAFVSNLALWRESGYFDPGSSVKPLQHLWSLAVEEQFYAGWPLALVYAWRHGRSLTRTTATIGAISFLTSVVMLRADATAGFYFPFGRLWELLLGGLLVFRGLEGGQEFGVRSRLLGFVRGTGGADLRSLAGATLVLAPMMLLNVASTFPGWNAVAPALGTALIISAGPDAWLNRTVLSARVCVWIGLVSFPLYLYHWPLLSFARILMGETPALSTRAALLCVSLAAATLTYRALERPIRSSGSPITVVGLCAGALAVGTAGLTVFLSGGVDRFIDGRLARDIFPDRWNADVTRQIPCPPGGWEEESPRTWCRTSAVGTPTMAVWGDSHAQHLFPGIALRDSRNWLIVGRAWCPPTTGIEVVVNTDGCKEHSARVLRQIAGMPEIQTVVLSFFSFYPDGTVPIADRLGTRRVAASVSSSESPVRSKEDLFFLGLSRTVQSLEAQGKSVIVFIDLPYLPFQPNQCVRATLTPLARPRDCWVSKEQVLSEQKTYRAILRRLTAAHPRTRMFDSLDALCQGDRCAAGNAEMMFYRDTNHLSLRGSGWMAGYFLSWMARKEDGPPLTARE